MGVHERNSKTFGDVTGDMRQWAYSEEEVGSLGRKLLEFKKMFVEIFHKHWSSALYTLRLQELEDMVEHIGRF